MIGPFLIEIYADIFRPPAILCCGNKIENNGSAIELHTMSQPAIQEAIGILHEKIRIASKNLAKAGWWVSHIESSSSQKDRKEAQDDYSLAEEILDDLESQLIKLENN